MRYVVQRMTIDNYYDMMGGHMGYICEKTTVEADTKEEAIEKARKDGYVVNEGYVRTVEEIEAEKRAEEEKAKAEKRAEEEKQKRAIAREEAKAEEMNMTVEEYKAYKKMVANKKRNEAEIRKAYKVIEEMKNKIAYYEKRVAYYEAEIEKAEK